MRGLSGIVLMLAIAFCATETWGQKKKGQAELPDHKVTEWKMGEVISGPEVKLEELEGKVVVIEFWGYRCPPCLASLPKMAKLDKQHRKKGLVIIGIHSQSATNEQILELVKKNKVEFTITTNSSSHGPIKFSGIPKVFVFDGEGKLVFDGRPDDDMEKVIKSELKKLK